MSLLSWALLWTLAAPLAAGSVSGLCNAAAMLQESAPVASPSRDLPEIISIGPRKPGDSGIYCPTDMEYIPPGTFLMGCYPGETGCFMSLAHPVTLTRGFCMDRTEVTQRQYKKSAGFNAAFFRRCGPECPVENVSWEQAYRYCARVGKRLPTEAEWEYAARAGMWDVFWWGHEPDGAYLWYRDNSFVKYKTGCSWCGGRGTHPVATKRSNPWGLHDMCGNVSEWVVDMYDRHWYQRSPDKDPVNTEPYIVASFSYRVSRGGNWSIDDHFVFISYRSYAAQDDSSPAIGFRCARDKLAP